MNIQDAIVKGFGYIERAYYIGVVLEEKIYHMQNLTTDLEDPSLKLINKDRNIIIHKVWLVCKENWKN